LKQRLKLFEATVTPTVLYGSASWTLTRDLENKVKKSQRRMLRIILGAGRRHVPMDGVPQEESQKDPANFELEPWDAWLRRTARYMEEQLESAHLRDWVSQIRSRKWRWCSKVVRQTDNRWTSTLLSWDPTCVSQRGRRQGRPVTRWADDIQKFLATAYDCSVEGGDDWMHIASNNEEWRAMEADYISHML
jgi:hypothetical protein